MNNKILIKIVFVYLVINYAIYQMLNIDSIDFIRNFLFCIVGIFTGVYVFNNNKNISPDRHFIVKIMVLSFLFFLYYVYNMDTNLMILYSRIHSLFLGADAIDFTTYPWIINFIIDSFIYSYALLSYLVSYASYKFTIHLLLKYKKRIFN